MKKYLIFFFVVILCPGCLSACSTTGRSFVDDNGKLQIVATIFPEYDWVMDVLGSNPVGAEVTMLLDNGVDLHSYQPTADDILKISSCDMFLYVGGESDEWVEDALKEAMNKDMVVINLLDVLGDSVKEEEVVEGMQEEKESEEEEETIEYDEHVWLSLHNASVFVEKIAEELGRMDVDHAEFYQTNAENYVEKLSVLDKQYQETVSKASVPTILFGDRFPFRYLADDYHLSYYAAFVGCSAETEASFETITFLAKKVDELSLHGVMTMEGTDHRIAETIIQNTNLKNQKIFTLDSMQSTTTKDIQNGTTYLSIMEKNLSVLQEALR